MESSTSSDQFVQRRIQIDLKTPRIYIHVDEFADFFDLSVVVDPVWKVICWPATLTHFTALYSKFHMLRMDQGPTRPIIVLNKDNNWNEYLNRINYCLTMKCEERKYPLSLRAFCCKIMPTAFYEHHSSKSTETPSCPSPTLSEGSSSRKRKHRNEGTETGIADGYSTDILMALYENLTLFKKEILVNSVVVQRW